MLIIITLYIHIMRLGHRGPVVKSAARLTDCELESMTRNP